MIRVAASELLYVTAFAYLGKQYDLLVRQKVKMTFFLDTHGLPSGSAISVTAITTPLWKEAPRPKASIDAKSRGCHLIACRSARSFLAMGHRLPGAVSSSRSTLSRRMVGLRGRTFLCVKRTHRPSRADGATASAEWFSPRPGRDVSARRKADAERLGIRPWLQVRAGMIGRISAWHA